MSVTRWTARPRVLAAVLAGMVVLGCVPACTSESERPKFSNLPAKCFDGLDDILKELTGPLYGLQRVDGPSLTPVGDQMTCSTKFQDSMNTIKQPGQPYSRDVTVMYSLYLDYQGQDAVSRAKDNFRSSVLRPAGVSTSSSLNIGDEAASWLGNSKFPGWNVEFRESNLIVLVTAYGGDYATDSTGKVTVQEWPNIPGQLREPAERAAKGIAQHGI